MMTIKNRAEEAEDVAQSYIQRILTDQQTGIHKSDRFREYIKQMWEKNKDCDKDPEERDKRRIGFTETTLQFDEGLKEASFKIEISAIINQFIERFVKILHEEKSEQLNG